MEVCGPDAQRQRNRVILELVSPADGTAVSELVSAQGMGGEELSLSISLANLDLFILLVKPCSQTLHPCFSSLSRQIALPCENTLSNMRWSNTKVMGNTEVPKWLNRGCCS